MKLRILRRMQQIGHITTGKQKEEPEETDRVVDDDMSNSYWTQKLGIKEGTQINGGYE